MLSAVILLAACPSTAFAQYLPSPPSGVPTNYAVYLPPSGTGSYDVYYPFTESILTANQSCWLYLYNRSRPGDGTGDCAFTPLTQATNYVIVYGGKAYYYHTNEYIFTDANALGNYAIVYSVSPYGGGLFPYSYIAEVPATYAALSTTSASPTYGASVTFTATVTSYKEGTPTGTVTFYDGGTSIGTGTLNAGVATFTTSALSVGTHSIMAIYSGVANTYEGSESSAVVETVGPASTSTSVSLTSGTNPSAYATSLTFTATVSSTGGTPTGTVQFSIDGSNVGSAVALSSGTATLTTSSLSAGTHSISAAYAATTNFAASTSSPLSQTVNPASTLTVVSLTSGTNPSAYSNSLTFTALVASAAGTPTGTVQFSVDGSNVGSAVALSSGTATLTTSSLSAGTHSITAAYSLTSNFAASTSSPLSQTVNKASTSIAVSLTSGTNPSTYSSSVTFAATVSPSVPNGETVTFYDGGTSIGTGTTSGGRATFATNTLTAGTHAITATYSGDSNYVASTSSAFSQMVNKMPTTVTVTSNSNPSTYSSSVTFTATVSASVPSGETVTFYDASTQIGTGTTSSGGAATFATNTLTLGTHSITATYSGDSNYVASTSPAVSQVVNKMPTTVAVTSSANPSTYSSSVTFTATVSPSVPNGETVTFYDGSTQIGTGTTSPGSLATFATNPLTTGTHAITATYSGDSNYIRGTSSVVSQVVNKMPTAVTVTASANPSTYGSSVTFTATVSPSVPNGETVTFYDGGANQIGTGTTSGSGATLTTNALAIGTHSVTATYSGDSNYLGSTSSAFSQAINNLPTTVTITSNSNPSTYSSSVTFTATVSPSVPNGETVAFYDGSTQIGTGTTSSGGTATFTTNALTAGTHSITAAYSGDSTYIASTSSAVSQVVNQLSTIIAVLSGGTPSTYGSSVTFTATVSPSVPSGETVAFYDGSTQIGTGTTSSGGTATFTTNALTAGTHSITAAYSGDSNYVASASSGISQVVNTIPTTTAINSNSNPSTYGSSVTFTATVSPSVPSGETVAFYDGSTQIGTGTTSSGGTATFTTNALTAGTHSITVAYSGDSNYVASTSSAVSQAVNKMPTTVAITSSANPSTYSSSVTFTATVSPSVPTGETVKFYDGSTQIGTNTTSGSTSTFTTNSFTLGTHSVTATYSGDSNYLGSTSSAFSQAVNKMPTTVTVASSANPSTYSSSVTFTATVSPSVPTGETVKFYDGSTQIGTNTTSGSTSTFTTNSFTLGTHSVTATYSGDSNYIGSTSSTVLQGVNKMPTTVTVASNANPSTYGSSVTFTSIVSPSVPSGEVVKFYDGSTQIGTNTTSGSTSTFTTNTLTLGSHSITAAYSGDSNYIGSTSSAVSQVMVSIPTISITPSSNNIDIGQAITYTANVPAGTGAGPFTVNLVYDGNVVSTNTIPDTSGNSITLSYTPTVLGQLTFNATATDTGTVPAYVFNSASNVITVNPVIPNSTYNFVVSVPSNTETNITYSKANATLSITSSNNVNTNVIISNVTSNYTSTPFVSYTHYSKVVLLNLTMVNSTPSTMVYGLTIGIPCGSNAAPYKLIGSSWHLLNYTSNTAACTITFNVPADPVIGLFTSVYLPPPSGGGGGYTASSGGSSPQGPGLKLVSRSGTTCYQITNFTTPNYEHFTLNGTSFAVTLSAIAPDSADLIINGITYVLKLDSPSMLFKNSNFNYTADVTAISYPPIEHTITVDVCSIAIPAATNVTNRTNNAPHSTTTIPENTTTNTPTTTIVPNPSNTSNAQSNVSTSNTPNTTPPASSSTYLLAAIVVVIVVVVLFLASRRTSKDSKEVTE